MLQNLLISLLCLSESTGLRHPDLFVLHGSNPSDLIKQ